MEPEPLADIPANPGFKQLVESRGVRKNILQAQVTLEEKHL
jgi:hypothetical protein